MNRLKKEIFNAPRHSNKIGRFKKYVDEKGLDRSKKATGIEGKGHWASRTRLYVAIRKYVDK